MEGTKNLEDVSGGDEKPRREEGRERGPREEMERSMWEMNASYERFLSACQRRIRWEQELRDVFAEGYSVLDRIRQVMAVAESVPGGMPTETLNRIMNTYSAVSYLALLTARDGKSSGRLSVPNSEGSEDSYSLYVSDEQVSPEEMTGFRREYFHRSLAVLDTGFGDRFAKFRFGDRKYHFLRSKGIEFGENPFGEIGIGETAMEYHAGEMSGTVIVEPTYEISPSEPGGEDRVVFRPALGDPLHGMTIGFVFPDISDPTNEPDPDVAWLEVTGFNPDVFEDVGNDDDDDDFPTAYGERYVEAFHADTGLPIVTEMLRREFVDRILPRFAEMIRDPRTAFENRGGYIPVRIMFGKSDYGKIVPAERESRFTVKI